MRGAGTVLHLLELLRRERVFGILGALVAVVVTSATGIYLLESGRPQAEIRGFGDALWWAIVTIATVGYGDVVPKTAAGRILAVFTMLGGVGLLSMVTATIASVFVERRIREERGLEAVKLKGHVVVCGWNPWADETIDALLAQIGTGRVKLVLVNELLPDEVEGIRQKHDGQEIDFVRGNYVHENVLRRANVGSALVVIVLPDSSGGRSMERADERTILATLAVKSVAPGTRTCAEVLDGANRAHLERANVDEVIVRGERTGLVLAGAAIFPGLSEVLDGILSLESEHCLARVDIPERFVGRPVGELRRFLAQEQGALLVALVREPPAFRLTDLLSHDMSAIDQFIKRKFEEAEVPLVVKGKRHQTRVNPGEDELIERGEAAFVIRRRRD
jgi:voltage-gated potassium channel